MLTRVKTIFAVLLCAFLCLFGASAFAQTTTNKQTVLWLTTKRQGSGDGPINNTNAPSHFSNGEYGGNANLLRYDGVLSSDVDAEIENYKTAFESLKPGDAVVVITGDSTSAATSPKPTITQKNIDALRGLMENATPEQGIAFFIFADGGRNGFTNSDLANGTLATSNIQQFVNIVNGLTGWSATAKLRFDDQTNNAINALGDAYKNSYRYLDAPSAPNRNRYDFMLAENARPEYKKLFEGFKTYYNGDAGLQAISGSTHAAITGVPEEFVLYKDLPYEVIQHINEEILCTSLADFPQWCWNSYKACTDCFDYGNDTRAYAVFAGIQETNRACVFLAGDSSMFDTSGFGFGLAKTLMEVAKSSACACAIDPATGKCCGGDNSATTDSFTGQTVCCKPSEGDTIANEGSDEFAMCCHAGKKPAKELGGSNQLCCPTDNIGKKDGVDTCCGQYKVGGDGVCCGEGEEAAPTDKKCCKPENVSAAGTCCTEVTYDETGKKVCCDDSASQAVVGSGAAARCYDKSLVGQNDAGENILCPHGVGDDGKTCADQSAYLCPDTESERTEQKVLFLSTDEWDAMASLNDICTSPTERKNVFGVEGITNETECRTECSALFAEPDHDIPESQWTDEQKARLKPLKDKCLRVAYDSERVELEKRRGDFFVDNAYDAFAAVVGADHMVDMRGDLSGVVSADEFSEANLPKGSVVVIATEYRPMNAGNVAVLEDAMKRSDLTFVIFADGCRTCNRQFPGENVSEDGEYGVGNDTQPAVLLPAMEEDPPGSGNWVLQPSNLERFAGIVSRLDTKAGDNIIVKSRIGEIFGRKQSTYLDQSGNEIPIGTGEEEHQVSFALKDSAVNKSVFDGLPAMDGYNPSVLTNLNAGYALYGDLTDDQIEWGQNLIYYQDCVESEPKCSPDPSNPDKWSGGYVSNRDYRADPSKFEAGDGDRGVAMFISRKDYNDQNKPGACIFLAGDLSFFDRHGRNDATLTDHTGQHTNIATILMNAAKTEGMCIPPEIKDCPTCDTAGGYNTIPGAGDGDAACCVDAITIKDSTDTPTECCTDGTVLKDATSGKPLQCCKGDTPTPSKDVKGDPVCCTTDVASRTDICSAGQTPADTCCRECTEAEKAVICTGDPSKDTPCCTPPKCTPEQQAATECKDGQDPDKDCCHVPTPPGPCPTDKNLLPVCEPGQVPAVDCCKPLDPTCTAEELAQYCCDVTRSECCIPCDPSKKENTTCEDDQNPDLFCCTCKKPYEQRPICKAGQVPAGINKSGTKAAEVVCCRLEPATSTPVPVNNPWALGLLGAAVAAAAAARRRRSTRRDDDA